MNERFYEAERPAESPGEVLQRCWQLYRADRHAELRNYLAQHERLRRIIVGQAADGIAAETLIELVTNSPRERQQLRLLFDQKPELLYGLPLLAKVCEAEPAKPPPTPQTSGPARPRPDRQIMPPARFRELMEEAFGLEQDRVGNPYATRRLIEIYELILKQLKPGEEAGFRAHVLFSLSAAYRRFSKGDPVARLQRAIACGEEALRLISPEVDRPFYVRILGQLGTTYNEVEGVEAVSYGQRGINYLEEAVGLMSPADWPRDRGVLLANLGNAYSHLPTLYKRDERLARALECYEAALSCFPADVAPLDYARIQTCRATVYFALETADNLSKALAGCQEALRYQTRENAPFDYASTCSNMGNIYRYLPEQVAGENYPLAVRCYENALQVFTPTDYAVNCLQTNEDLGDVHGRAHNWGAAYAAYRAAIFAGEILYKAHQGAASQLAGLARLNGVYRLAAYAAAHCGAIAEALLTLEHGKARMLNTALATDQITLAEAAANDWQTFDRAVEAALHGSQAGYLSAEKQFYSGFNSMLADLQKSLPLVDLLGGLAPQAATKPGKVYDPALLRRVETASRSLVPDEQTALISFCVCELGSLAFVVPRDPGTQIACVEAPGFTLGDLRKLLLWPQIDGGWLIDYTNFRANLQSKAASEKMQATLTHLLAEVGRRLIRPLVDALPQQVTKLILLPAAELILLPLHAAPINKEGYQYFCDRYEISYAPSARVLANCYARAARPTAQSSYVVANPTEDPHLALSELAGARIAALFSQSVLQQGLTATKQAVQAEAPRHGYLHFYCHGNYMWDDPRAAYLQLAPTSSEQRGGRLTFDDLRSGFIKSRDARLVVLGSCDTGLNDMGNQTPEEYIGLAAGFLQAGVPCVICPLWTVEVVPTILLLDRFYTNHRQRQMSFTAALQEAQRWLRELTADAIRQQIARLYREVNPAIPDNALRRKNLFYWQLAKEDPDRLVFAHPYYWAGFTINGV